MAKNMLEGLGAFNLKGVIHSSVWSTNTFLYKFREPRYKQIKIGYHISKFLNKLGLSCAKLSKAKATY